MADAPPPNFGENGMVDHGQTRLSIASHFCQWNVFILIEQFKMIWKKILTYLVDETTEFPIFLTMYSKKTYDHLTYTIAKCVLRIRLTLV